MKVLWSDFSSDILLDIFAYYKENVCYAVAKNIKTNIFKATKQLIKHPFSGQIEESLKHLKEEHRYLVEGNYKIVYKQVEEGILITDIFDARQDPMKINDLQRKPGK
jgi:plasmid stabilization system protein ParE